MRIGTFWYCLKEGIKNIGKNIWFSLASMAIISACIFLFCIFFSLVANVQYMVRNVETTVGITVFFDEDLGEAEIKAIGDQIGKRPEVKEYSYVSPEEAWDSFKEDYFEGMEELAAGFEEDNPLADSASYTIFLKDLTKQEEMVSWLKSLDGVRRVNYSKDVAAGMTDFNKMLGGVSLSIILLLLAVAVVGIIIGLAGAAVPLGLIYVVYKQAAIYLEQNFQQISSLIVFLPIQEIFPYMAGVAMVLGVGIGFVGSFFTIRRHLKV